MRWDHMRLLSTENGDAEAAPLPLPLPFEGAGVQVRTIDTPEFRGVTFYEIRAKSILNRVPASSPVPFQWTVNPYRGCTHACTYCFARNTHTYLDLDAGHDFDSRIVVKVNAGELLRRELGARSWAGEHVAMGTNTDPYQRAEGRYGLMREVITALRDHANPFSILTKGTLVLRDLDLLTEAAQVTDVRVNVSVGFVDAALWRQVEPGTPNPRARLGVCRALTDAGIGCGVLMAPVLPYLTDTDEQLEATVAAIADAGAVAVTPLTLHLRPGAREWFLGWLRGARPDLVGAYRRLYRESAYAPAEYTRALNARVHEIAASYGIGRRTPSNARDVAPEEVTAEPAAQQLMLL
ncbi:Rv2578c family radical SAM protein [Cryptosporangium aurantiacum]|uniref:DNA repair photolyase n=1 Tax=Cryptosporangium aurantiacum TaxID=134849 RepID=A0A1M7QQ83_9ACTN|nr:Rv2578c family radical SAM protein [Cryptosporangium aurantiacum]SHN33369.1 DNA repair photolyase [Cryptosporangium aurantiacum]